MKNNTPIEIQLHSQSTGTAFTSLLQRGITLPLEKASAIQDILLSLPGFTKEYIEEKIQTLFVNGTPADSLLQEISGGSTLAISAAMPGLAGAIFKKQSIHGSLRSQAAPTIAIRKEPYITIKIFNLIAAEKGEDLLTTGCTFTGKVLHQYFSRHRDQWPSDRAIASHQGAPITMETLLKLCQENTLVHIRQETQSKPKK